MFLYSFLVFHDLEILEKHQSVVLQNSPQFGSVQDQIQVVCAGQKGGSDVRPSQNFSAGWAPFFSLQAVWNGEHIWRLKE